MLRDTEYFAKSLKVKVSDQGVSSYQCFIVGLTMYLMKVIVDVQVECIVVGMIIAIIIVLTDISKLKMITEICVSGNFSLTQKIFIRVTKQHIA